MERNVVKTAAAPAAIGPYSQAITVQLGGQRMVFCSGMIALDPVTGNMVGEGDVEAQTRRVLQSIGGVLEAAGATVANVVKTTIFLKSMGDFAKVNAIYGETFVKDPPARETVEAAALPRGALVEISVTAVV